MLELLEIWQVQSVDVKAQSDLLNSLFVLYAIVCCLIKRPVFLLAFLLPELMFNLAAFDIIKEWQLNGMEFIIYSYVFFLCQTNKSKIACFIICYTAAMFGIDSYFYGVDGIHGERETIIYQNISLINACAHIFLISTLISISRIRDSLRRIIDFIVRISADSAYMCIYCYNINKIK